MLDYKEIIIKHYGGGMSGSELAALKLGSRSGINDFLRAFEACEKIGYPLPDGITNYGIAELVYGATVAAHNTGRKSVVRDAGLPNSSRRAQWAQEHDHDSPVEQIQATL